MTSGFNHVKIALGDDFTVGQFYKVTEQIDSDIFTNNKALYCNIIFPRSLAELVFVGSVVCVMTMLEEYAYVSSIIVPSDDGFIIFTLGLYKSEGDLYFSMNLKAVAGAVSS